MKLKHINDITKCIPIVYFFKDSYINSNTYTVFEYKNKIYSFFYNPKWFFEESIKLSHVLNNTLHVKDANCIISLDFALKIIEKCTNKYFLNENETGDKMYHKIIRKYNLNKILNEINN